MAQNGSSRPARFQGPKGTRDFYPAEMARRRYIEQAWRTVSIRHGFEEIEGPTFEAADLYAVKSGEAILGELFQAFSGKSPEEVEQVRATGRAPYALRPEFTPTLARMYADRAASLPRPTKWFAIPIHYRAERPQRGRLREFLQWNADILGWDFDESTMNQRHIDIELFSLMVDLFRELGLTARDVRIKVHDRAAVRDKLKNLFGIMPAHIDASMALLDERAKIDDSAYRERATALGWPKECIERFHFKNRWVMRFDANPGDEVEGITPQHLDQWRQKFETPGDLLFETKRAGLLEWCEWDDSIIRGLAYYTGFVFEAHEATGAERAIAGGGRYDGLVQLLGGPPTPAVGFGMGDVVLSLVLEEHGLMPEGERLAECLGTRPDAFVVSVGDESCDAAVAPLVAELRRAGLHARRSYKATKKIDKLLKDAAACWARFAVILDESWSAGNVQVKNFADGTQHTVPRAQLAPWISKHRTRLDV